LDGTISGNKMILLDSPTVYIDQNKIVSKKSIDVNKFHEKTAQVHALKFKGDFAVFKDCDVANARLKKVSKDWKGGSQVPGERVYLDISSIEDESYGASCFWALLVDDYTDYC
jgi:hypothetical protein